MDEREKETRPKRSEGGRRRARGRSTGGGDKPSAGLYGSDIGANMARAAVAPVAVGFALAASVFIGGPVTGGSVNPARALGPIIVAWENWGTALIYVLAPIVGGVLAAVLYDRFISEAKAPDEDDAS